MKPMIDPKRDLEGATPETLAHALLRPVDRSVSRARVEAVVRVEVVVEQVSADDPADGVPHLHKRV